MTSVKEIDSIISQDNKSLLAAYTILRKSLKKHIAQLPMEVIDAIENLLKNIIDDNEEQLRGWQNYQPELKKISQERFDCTSDINDLAKIILWEIYDFKEKSNQEHQQAEKVVKERKLMEELLTDIQEWLADDSGYDEEVYPQLERMLSREKL